MVVTNKAAQCMSYAHYIKCVKWT